MPTLIWRQRRLRVVRASIVPGLAGHAINLGDHGPVHGYFREPDIEGCKGEEACGCGCWRVCCWSRAARGAKHAARGGQRDGTGTTPGWVLDASSLGKIPDGRHAGRVQCGAGRATGAGATRSAAPAIMWTRHPFRMGVIVMIENDSVARFDVENPGGQGTRRARGGRPGDRRGAALCGASITVSPHAYTGPDETLPHRDAAGRHAASDHFRD